MAWRLPLRIALRNLRSGAGGFRIFLVCLILGVAAIASVGSLSEAVKQGLAEEGQPLLGGDMEFALIHRQMSDEQIVEISRHGDLSRVATLRAMASSSGHRTLVEVKAIDDRYPLYGKLALAPAAALADALRFSNGRHGVAVDPLLLARLDLKVGDSLRIGELEFDVRASVLSEPDRVSDGFILGPRVLMSAGGLDATGLIKPGSLITWRYRLKLEKPGSMQDIAERLQARFPDAGWRVRLRDAAAPGVARYVERLTLFLTLVGLTSLIVGGLGVANAVKAFVDKRRRQMALLRYVGAAPRTVFAAAFAEVMILAVIGTVAGVALGALLPALLTALFAGLLPVPVASGVFPEPLLSAAIFGLITAAAFALWPLGAIRNIAAVELIRGSQGNVKAWPGVGHLVLTVSAFGALAAWAFVALDHPSMTRWYGLGVVASFLVLIAVGNLVVALARNSPKPRHAAVRFAIANLHRPGTATPAIVLSLGLGLAMFVMLSLVDRSVTRELTSSLPEEAPSFFFLDVDKSEKERFVAAVKAEPGARAVTTAPMLRGRIVSVKGTPAEKAKSTPDAAWALRGDRGLTFADTLPAGSRLVAGQWWQAGYQGPPLVSLTRDIAEGLGLAIGDEMTVNVLGREVSARIASLREVDWRSLGINFVMVFSPNALAAAPHSNLVTVNVAADRQDEFLNRVADAFPTVTAISVKDALDSVSSLLGKVVLAVRFTNGLTLASGVLVLAGALTTSLAARRYEAAVLKTYGATRAQLITVFAVEFLIAGMVTAIFAVIVGSIAAWALTTYILEIEFRFSFAVASMTALLSMIATLVAGLATTWSALAARPAALLREA
ncbi:MAG: ABC transporter permease [Dongiaceae bacterium]